MLLAGFMLSWWAEGRRDAAGLLSRPCVSGYTLARVTHSSDRDLVPLTCCWDCCDCMTGADQGSCWWAE